MRLPKIVVIGPRQNVDGTLAMVRTMGSYDALGIGADTSVVCRLRALHPALVILDMPVRDRADAWELAERLHSDATTADTPLIICSADAFFLNARKRTLSKRGWSVLAKPFVPEQLRQRIAERMTAPRPTSGHTA
ncbi:MAG: hypothetical protein LC793_12135 [Thermomicrobia bacterium]|nr:hypothetical protein [Thermomicrobia bacterium]